METWKIILLCALCLGAGIYIGSILEDKGDGDIPVCTDPVCCEQLKKAMAGCATILPPDAPPASITPVNDITVLRSYRQSYATSADNYGYSVDRDLILYLGTLLDNGPAIKGFRFYPGMNGSNRLTIYIGLTEDPSGSGQLLEDPASMKGFQYKANGLQGYTGPCPAWCGTLARVL